MLRFASTPFTSGLATAAIVSSLATAAALYSPAAQACGGNFCDAGPTSMPVDQTGENIIFVMEPGQVEAHIQIQYDPDTSAETFAWVIPVMSLPEFSVGSELFFEAVLDATVPIYALGSTTESCGDSSGESSDSGGSSEGTSTGTGGDGGGGPTVVYEETVGAFDIAVLEGGTVQEVMTWLDANGYQQDPAAMPILGEYVDEGFLFAAMKLTTDAAAGTDTIHPITLRMQSDEACVPLRLTAIAAAIDMDVRTLFFAQNRVVPTNYRHVEVNPLKIDWVNTGSNYKDVVSLAVDVEGADGNAFVTEFAGPNPGVNSSVFYDANWGTLPGAAAALVDSPVGLYEAMQAAGLFNCTEDYWEMGCFANHPLLDGLLGQYLPVPDGIEPLDFYPCLSCYAALIDLEAWDAAAFSQAVTQRIVEPSERARDIVIDYPYITRMYTTISDHEMNADPIFRENPDLDPVVAYRQADRVSHCDGTGTMTLPDGREVYMPNANVWPDIFPNEMPWEETVARGTVTGALMPVQTRTVQINELLDSWNDDRPAGSEGGETGDAGGNNADGRGGACACDANDDAPQGLLFSVLGLLGLGSARRRRSAA